MKSRTNPSAAEIQEAIEFQSMRPPQLSRAWHVYFQGGGSPVLRKYQDRVPASRVLRDHAAATHVVPLQADEDESFSLAARARIREDVR